MVGVACPWCGAASHTQLQCPRISAIEFDRDLNITRVEFLTPKAIPPQESMDYPRLTDKVV